MLSVFDMFKVGIGPSSSHTVGPMTAARRFLAELENLGVLSTVDQVRVKLYGSLGATGHGHGSDRAVLAGLMNEQAATVDPDLVRGIWEQVTSSGFLMLGGTHKIAMNPASDVRLYRNRSLPAHPNGIRFEALSQQSIVHQATYYSVGGGFVVNEMELGTITDALPDAPWMFSNANELLGICHDQGKSMARIMLENELSTYDDQAEGEREVYHKLDYIWQTMEGCVETGLHTEGILPGGLHVVRRASGLAERLESDQGDDELAGLDWLTCFAMAVNEENAAGGRVVTAPTNGAAGVIPSVLYYLVHRSSKRLSGTTLEHCIRRFLLTAGAIGMVIKMRASLSGAEVGCQGEVGSACAMAAAGLVAYRGGTPRQIENAAEIAMEHCLGLTCDPIAGLVQIPCIERNAVAACHAVSAARTALHGDGTHMVSFDEVVETMRVTGLDMRSKYRETARGGLAVNTALC